MAILDGLYGYEIALLVCGCALFLLGFVLAIVFAIQGKSLLKLAILFAFAIVMIGFPTYSKIQISKDGITLEKNVHQLELHPADNALREQVSTEVAKLAARPIADPNLYLTVAKAQVALGNDQAAKSSLARVLQARSRQQEAIALKQKIELNERLDQLTTQVERNPSDAQAKHELIGAIAQASQTPTASPVTIDNVARAHAVLGNAAQAKKYIEMLDQINPKLLPQVTLKSKAVKVQSVESHPYP